MQSPGAWSTSGGSLDVVGSPGPSAMKQVIVLPCHQRWWVLVRHSRGSATCPPTGT